MKPLTFSRRSFVAVTASAVALSNPAEPAVAQAKPAPVAPNAAGTVPYHFDRAAFMAVIDRPYPHRQLVAPASWGASTIAIAHFKNSLAAYADPNGFDGGPKSLHCAAVLYMGYSIHLALNDAMWAKYPIGLMSDEEMRPTDLTYRAYWTALKTNTMIDSMRPLMDQGLSLFVCNNALSGLSLTIAQRVAPSGTTVTRDQVVAVHDDLAANFVPNTILVPAGVAAVNAAQEARFTFMP
jgi:intracellular sulfur oxidation DsrE/DsrF family protein